MSGRGSLASHITLARAYRARQREQWYSREALRDLRVQRLRRLTEVAVRAPFYREVLAKAGLRPEDFASKDALQALPILDKQDVRTRAEEMLTEDAGTLGVITTSGSTGRPLRILRSTSDQAQVSAAWMRVQRAYGRRFFHRQVNLGSGRGVVRKGPVLVLQRLGLAPKTHQISSFDPIEQQIAVLRALKPEVLSGYAVALETLAAAMIERGVTDVRPLIVMGGGMELTDRCRALAQEAFGGRVLDIYAANEVGTIAWECPVTQGVLHLNDDVQITEVLDDGGRPVGEGGVGHVIVTQLSCTALPLIRYRIGDLAAVGSQTCTCGRQLGSIGKVQGRVTTTLRSKDGRVLNNVVLSAVLGPYRQVERYQIRQVGPEDLSIAVVPAKGWTPKVGDAIVHDLKERLGDSFRYQLRLCDEIPLAPGGKFQTIVPMAESKG
jgi:phenylacetate-CoA ligase